MSEINNDEVICPACCHQFVAVPVNVQNWVSAWTKDGNNGKWISLAFKPKERQSSQRPERQPEKRQIRDPWE